MSTILLVVAVVLFLLAGLASFATGVNLDSVGLIAFGLAAFAGASLVP